MNPKEKASFEIKLRIAHHHHQKLSQVPEKITYALYVISVKFPSYNWSSKGGATQQNIQIQVIKVQKLIQR